MMRRLAVILAVALVALIFAGLIRDYAEQAGACGRSPRLT